jgi:hypothetical protein
VVFATHSTAGSRSESPDTRTMESARACKASSTRWMAMLIYPRDGGINQLTSRINCDGVIRKGCPEFFCTRMAGGVLGVAWGCPARRASLRSRATRRRTLRLG